MIMMVLFLNITKRNKNSRNYWVRLLGFYVVERLSANFSENCSEADSGRPLGSRGKFKTVQAFYTLRRPVMREVVSTRIWGVPPACLGSR